jgi:hypothetical protein
MRGAIVIALVFCLSCKKEPPKGDLPPVGGSTGTPAAAAPANPHAAGSGAVAPPLNASAPKPLEKQADGSYTMGPFALAVPADWKVKSITSNMRAGDFELPAKPGAEAELIVYYFGPNGAGSVEDNLDRWLGQFKQADGKPSRDVAKIEKLKFGGQDATFVSVTGRFVTQGMPGGGGPVDKADQVLLAAIVESPKGPYYFKLVGDKAPVDGNAAAFRGLLDSLKVH